MSTPSGAVTLAAAENPRTNPRARRRGRFLVGLLLSALALPGFLSAKTFTVNDTSDPEIGDPRNCKRATASCSLRDALAAADQSPTLDRIEFDVDGATIYLTSQLVAEHPVAIDGGMDKTIVRVDQRYELTVLTDRFKPYGPVQVLQPVFSTRRGSDRAMLKLRGDGSTVENMVIDGSITPDPADLGVARVDYEPDDLTDFFLFTLDCDGDGNGDCWPIAGAIEVDFFDDDDPPGAAGFVEIHGNELRNLDLNAISIANSRSAEVTDNVLFGGAAGQQYASADGIYLFLSEDARLSGNSVSDFRTGVNLSVGQGFSVLENRLEENVTGVDVQFSQPGASNRIEDNQVTSNLYAGIVLRAQPDTRVAGNLVHANGVFGIQLTAAFFEEDDGSTGNEVVGNQVSSNGLFGIDIYASHDNAVTDNVVGGNGSGEATGGILVRDDALRNSVLRNEVTNNPDFGIAISGAHDNLVRDNDCTDNGGTGIAVANGALDNRIELNRITGNTGYGIFTGITFAAPFPTGNLFEGNEILGNSLFDVLDTDPECNDAWVSNLFGFAYAESGTCIE